MNKQKLPQFKKLREFSNQHREEMERRVLDSRPASTSSWQGGWSSTNVDKLELTGKTSLRVRSEATHREDTE